MDESPREELVSQLLVASELGRRVARVRRRSSAQIDCNSDSDAIHDLHGADQVLGRGINVLVQVDDPVFPPPAVGGPVHGGNIGHRLIVSKAADAAVPIRLRCRSATTQEQRQKTPEKHFEVKGVSHGRRLAGGWLKSVSPDYVFSRQTSLPGASMPCMTNRYSLIPQRSGVGGRCRMLSKSDVTFSARLEIVSIEASNLPSGASMTWGR